MTKYLEEFSINKSTFGIEQCDDFFQVWYNGGGIGKCETLDEARRITHHYATNQLRAEISGYQDRLQAATHALDGLGDDVFRLGKFSVT